MVKIDEMLKKPYARVITPAPEGGYTAEVVEFPGCVTQGETVEEAYANLEDAAREWLEAVIQAHQVVPEPLAAEDFSGKVVLRLPKSLHGKASRYAQREEVSLNTFLLTAVAQYVGERSPEHARIGNKVVTEVRIVDGGKRRKGSSLIYGIESIGVVGARLTKRLLAESDSHKEVKTKKR